MREIRPSGSEGGGQPNRSPYPYLRRQHGPRHTPDANLAAFLEAAAQY